MRENLIRESFSYSLIEYKVFSDKAYGKFLRARLTGMLNESTLKRPDLTEPGV